MDRVILLEPQEDPIERITGLLLKRGRDYTRNLVVFPGKRPAHYLRKAIGKTIGGPFRPPIILSMDGFIDALYRGISDSRPMEVIDAVALLYELSKGMDSLPEGFRELDRFYPLGVRIFRVFEELYIEGVSPERLKGVEALVEIPGRALEDIDLLSTLYEAFYREVEERGFSTRSLRYRRVSDGFSPELLTCLGDSGPERMIFSGFFAFTASERRIVKDLLEVEGAFFLFRKGRGLSQALKDLGLEDEGTCEPEYTDRDLRKIQIHSAPDTHGEAYRAGEIIKKMEGVDESTLACLPGGDSLFPLIREGIPFLSDYNISMGYPLKRTPLYGFFKDLFQLLESMEGEALHVSHYLKFMLHPYTKNILFKGRAETGRMVIHALEDLLIEEGRPFVEVSWIEEEMPGRITTLLKDEGLLPDEVRGHLKGIHDMTVRTFLSIKDMGDFARRCKELLIYIYENSTARLHPFFHPYAEAFLRDMDRLSSSLIRGLSFARRESYFLFFERFIEASSVPFEGTPLRGLQILGFLETRGLRFRKVIFFDLNEGVFPDLSEDPLLPSGVREALGLVTPSKRERTLLYYFDTLLRGAEEVHLLFVKDGRMERSRFLERIIWEMEKARGAPFEEEPVLPVGYRVSLAPSGPSEIPKTAEVMDLIKEMVLTPSSLEAYLRCGLRFYYSAILGLREREDLEVDRSDIGNVVHEALREYFGRRLGKPLEESDLQGREMEEIVDRIFSRRYGRDLYGRLYLIKGQIKKRLLHLLEYQKEVLGKGSFQILSVEKEIGIGFEGATLRCRPDRVEERGGRIYVVDYKISGNRSGYTLDFKNLDPERRETWSKAIRSLQVPLYILLYGKASSIPYGTIDGYYLLLGGDGWEFFPLGDDGHEEKLLMILEVVRGLIKELKDPSLPFRPADDLKDSCPYCSYQSLCGTALLSNRPLSRSF